MRRLVAVLLITAVALMVTNAAWAAAVPVSGSMALNGIGFEPVPWVSPAGSEVLYFYPFLGGTTLSDYSGNGPGFNLGQAQFSNGNINVSTYANTRTDYLGIRIGNYAGYDVTFAATKVTLDIQGQGDFDLWLPEFTFSEMENIYFWVATDGSTYYANSSNGDGAPDMLPDAAMSGDNHLAAVPEPATLALVVLGAGLLGRRRR